MTIPHCWFPVVPPGKAVDEAMEHTELGLADLLWITTRSSFSSPRETEIIDTNGLMTGWACVHDTRKRDFDKIAICMLSLVKIFTVVIASRPSRDRPDLGPRSTLRQTVVLVCTSDIEPTIRTPPQQVLRASAGIASTDVRSVGGDNEGLGYKTLLGHLYDLLEEKITTERYEEGVRQLVGNQVRRHALPLPSPHGRVW